MKGLLKNKKGLTLVEILISTLLIGVVFLAVSALFVASQRFHFGATDKVMVGYELQYAMAHIYKNAMQAIGDNSNAAITVSGDELQLTVRHIDSTDPDSATPPTYGDYTDDSEITYTITANGRLSYEKSHASTGQILEQESDMIPQVTLLFTDDPYTGEQLSRFYMDGETLKIKLTAEFLTPRSGTRERSALYSACYPRLASFK